MEAFMALEREIQTYNLMLPKLLRDAGKFVIIKDDRVEGILEAYADALRIAYGKYPEGGFLVKRISPTSQIANFTRDLVVGCRA